MRDPAVDAIVLRSERWSDEIDELRGILLDERLTETVKWRSPCYTHDGANIAIIQEMKDFLSLMFFKGALVDDPDGVLVEQGANTRSARRICVRSVADVRRLATAVRGCVRSAIAVEAAGRTIDPAPELELVAELQERLDADPALRAAFEALTPGRQREYHLHVSGAKRASTRVARVDACVPRILDGKGRRDR